MVIEKLDKKLYLDGFLPYRLSVAANKLSKAIQNEYFSRYHLSIPEWRVIVILASKGNMTARDLTKHTAMDKVQISRAVKQLSKNSYIEKTHDMEDKRSFILSLTIKGGSVFNQIKPLVLDYEQKIASEFTVKEWNDLKHMLLRLEKTVQNLSDEEI